MAIMINGKKIGNLITYTKSGDGGSIYVDIDKYNIRNINFNHKPPYTNEEYEIAYNNMEGFKQVLSEASINGYSNITFPKGYYPMCYQNPRGQEWYGNFGWEIMIPSNCEVNLNGSTIKIIYDSENKNPYDTSKLAPAKLTGRVFTFNASHKSSLKNGEIIGDRYDRAYSQLSVNDDKWCEQTYGVRFINGSKFCNLYNLKIHGFMGDAIQSDGTSDPELGKIEGDMKFYPGKADGTQANGFYSTNYLQNKIIGNEMVLRTNMGYTYVPDFENQTFLVTFYDSDKNVISSESGRHLQVIILPRNCEFIKLTIDSEAENQEVLDKVYQLTPPPSSYVHISECEIFNNNRGGMSNLPLDVTISKCHIYENGEGKKMGWPNFPDTTRYAINCEDTVTRKITIDDCYIHDHFNTLLISGKDVVVRNNMFKNCGTRALFLYHSENAIFSGNTLYNSNGVGFSYSNYKYQRKAIVVNNQFVGNCEMLSKSQNTYCVCKDNIATDATNIVASNLEGCTFVTKKILNTYLINGISGKIKDCNFEIIHPQYSTTRTNINMLDTSSNNYIYAPKVRVHAENMYGCEAILWIQLMETDQSSNVVNSKISFEEFADSYYGRNDNKAVYRKFTNTTIAKCGLFKMGQNTGHNADKIVNMNYIFEDCDIHINQITRDIIFSIGVNLSGENQNVSIKFINCKITNDKTSYDTVYLINQDIKDNPKISFEMVNCEMINVAECKI